MLNKMAIMLVFLFLHCISYAHDDELMCFRWDDWTCVPGSAFSAANVHQVHNTKGRDGPSFLEASWHETEPVLVMIYGHLFGPKWLDIMRLEYIDGFAMMMGDGESLRHLPGLTDGHDPGFTELLLTSDTIVVGTADGDLLFWESGQEKFLYELPVSDGWVSEVLLHPSNEWLLVVIDFAKLFRVDLDSQAVAEIHLQANEVRDFDALAFSSDGRLLAAAGNGTLGIWQADTWEAWEPRPLSADSAEALRFTDDDSHLLVISYASVNRWSLNDKRLEFVRKLESTGRRRNCFINDGDISPDGSLLMTTDDCGQIRAWDLAADAEIYVPQLDFSEPFVQGEVIQFNPDGRLLFTGGSFGWGLWIIHQPE